MGEEINAACDKCDSPLSSDSDDNCDEPGTECNELGRQGECMSNGVNECNHSPQCVIRQPHPPPLPTITHIRNNKSKYHLYMLTDGVPGRFGGHEKCLDAYSKNYGCESCIWLKWYGELHGFPDVSPSIFRKYLDPD